MASFLKVEHKGAILNDAGYFLLVDDKLILHGFPELTDTKKVRLTCVDDGVVTIHYAEEEIENGEYFIFNEKTKSSKVVIDYLEEKNAIGHLFIKLFGCYFLCKDLEIIPDLKTN